MRVGFLLEQCLAPVPGGTGRYSRELARALARTAPVGATLTGFTAWHRDVAAAVVDGVAGPRRLPLPRRALITSWARGLGPVPSTGDVLHAPTLLAPPRRGVPLVVTIHDAVPWTHPETLTRRGVTWHRQMAARVARTADRIVVPTQAVARELRELLSRDEGVVVIGEGVADTMREPGDAAARRAALGVIGSYFASVGTLEPRKGIDVALDALARPTAPGLPLVVVGSPGWGGIDVAREAARRGLEPSRVRVLSRLDDADVAAVLAGAVALVAPSRAEGFGLPALEAMSLGVPVVISDAPALVEVAGDAALVVPVGDAGQLAETLARVAGDDALRTRLGTAGRRRAHHFTWDGAAERLWAVYDEVIGRS